MINVLYGKKGMGKTKILIDKANDLSKESPGNVVFLDYTNQLMCDLHYKVRFINVSEYPVKDINAFFGFICGIISVNYDVQHIFIDGITYIINKSINEAELFFESLKQLSEKFSIDFLISANGDPENIPDFLKQYIMRT